MNTTALQSEANEKLVAFLAPSGLTPEDVPNWRVVDPFSLNVLLGYDPRTSRVQHEGVEIPYVGLDGQRVMDQGLPFCRVRLIGPSNRGDPSKSEAKYLSPMGAGVHVYVPARSRVFFSTGTVQTLVITEGEKKAELLSKMGVCAVALPGIHMGRVRVDSGDKTSAREISPEVLEVVGAAIQAGMTACVVLFDAEGLPRHFAESSVIPAKMKLIDKRQRLFVRNDNVYYEALGLAKALREQFIDVPFKAMWADVPKGWTGEDPMKAGVDDWALSLGEADTREAILRVASSAVRVTKQERDSETKRQEALQEEGYHPLGMSVGKGGEPVAVVWSKRNGHLVQLGSTEMSRQATLISVFGPEYSRSRWPKFDKNGIVTSLDMLAAQSEIISACQSKSSWSSSRERGGGAWAEKEDLYVNAKEGLFRFSKNGDCTILEENDRHRGRNIYPRTSDYAIGIDPATLNDEFWNEIRDPSRQRDDLNTLIRHFSMWGGLNETGKIPAMLLAGWILAQNFLGALQARPSIIISGESGAGKSLLSSHINEVLGKTAIRIDDGSSTTEPGVRQKLGKDAQALLLDEAEPGSSNAAVSAQRSSNLRRVLNLLRAAYSTSDSATTNSVAALKGSADGRAVDYSLRTAAILFAIGKPDLEQADLNRTILLELRKKNRSKTIPTAKGLHDLGVRLRMTMWTHWADFQAILDYLHDLCGDSTHQLNIEARLANTWGVPLAAVMCLMPQAVLRATQPEAMTPEARQEVDTEAVFMLKQIKTLQESLSPAQDGGSDADQALNMIMRCRVRIQIEDDDSEGHTRISNMEKSVSECLYRVYQIHVANDARTAAMSEWQNSLKRYGISYMSGYDKLRRANDPETPPTTMGYPRHMLFVSDSSELRKILAGTPFSTQNIESVLIRLPGAQRMQSRMAGGLRMTGVRMPFEMYDNDGNVIAPPPVA